jgi:hypothetical protein
MSEKDDWGKPDWCLNNGPCSVCIQYTSDNKQCETKLTKNLENKENNNGKH